MLYVKPNGSGPRHWRALSQADDDTLAREAAAIFRSYHQAAQRRLERYRRNDTIYRESPWALSRPQEPGELRPHTPVLWATCDNVHADLVDACPGVTVEANGGENADRAQRVSALLKALLRRMGWARTWQQATAALVRQGTDVLEVCWDKELCGGLGDVRIRRWGLDGFLFDPEACDLEDSPAVIQFRHETPDDLAARYPRAAQRLADGACDPPDTAADGRALIYDLWWREEDPDGEGGLRRSVHMCRVAAGIVVERVHGVYEHGRYPFLALSYDDAQGALHSRGIIDRFAQAQAAVDLCDQMVLKNLLCSARQKLLVNENAALDMDALRDWRADIITGADVTDDAVRWVDTRSFDDAPLRFAQWKVAQIKEESGQNDFVRGDGGRGITAASAIKALQDAGNKRSRARIDGLYARCEEAFRLCLALMGQFYTERRSVVLRDGGHLTRLEVGQEDFRGADGQRQLDFEITLHAERSAGYNTLYNNEQAMALARDGLLPPQLALELMDFNRKDEVMSRLRREGQNERRKENP